MGFLNAKSNRNSNVELLRIIAMLLIVIHHYAIHGLLVNGNFANSPLNLLLARLFVGGGKIGVDIFVIITGYYLCKSKFKFERIISLLFQASTYSIVIYAIFTVFKIVPFGIKASIKNVFPLFYNQYWFVTTYMMLILVSPVLNNFISNTSAKKITSVTFSGFAISFIITEFIKADFGIGPLFSFCVLYLIGALIRLNVPVIVVISKHATQILYGSLIVLVLSVIVLDIAGSLVGLPSLSNNAYYFTMDASPFSVVVAMSLMIISIRMNVRHSTPINHVASLVFGVYLLHDNLLIRPVLWKVIIKTQTLSSLPTVYFLLMSLIAIGLLFALCLLIEQVRLLIFGGLFKKTLKLLRPISRFIDSSVG